MLSLILAFVAGAACAGGATAWFLCRRSDDEGAVRDILRLAGEIEAVAATVDAELEGAADDPPCVVLRQRCRDARERATQALAQGKALRLQDGEALITTLLLLHEDHRRMVDLRLDVDRALARKAQDRSRIIHFGRSKPSSWHTSSLLTRPSTFS